MDTELFLNIALVEKNPIYSNLFLDIDMWI